MTSVAICLVAAMVAGVAVARGVRHVAAPRPAPAAPVILRTSPHPPPARHAPAGAPVALLTRAVRRLVSAQEGGAARRDYGTASTGRPIVRLTRANSNRSWAFGTTVIPVPAGTAAPPWTALFLAHAIGGRWHIALSGTARFGQMLVSASPAVLSVGEKQLLARFNAAQEGPAAGAPRVTGSPLPAPAPHATNAPPASTPPGAGPAPASGPASPAGAGAPGAAGTAAGGTVPGSPQAPASPASPLALPWQAGQSWRFVAAFSGSDTSQAGTMFAFSGGDGRVLASGPGRLYRFCGGPRSDALIEIIHPDGSATEYYQLSAETHAADGSLVAAGTYLGRTGMSLACGGTVPGPGPGLGQVTGKKASVSPPGAVSFALIAGGAAANLNGLTLGGWTFHQQAVPPLVWAQRGAVRIMLGGLLGNFGAVPAVPTGPAPAPGPMVSPAPSPDPSPSSSSGQPAALGLPQALGPLGGI